MSSSDHVFISGWQRLFAGRRAIPLSGIKDTLRSLDKGRH